MRLVPGLCDVVALITWQRPDDVNETPHEIKFVAKKNVKMLVWNETDITISRNRCGTAYTIIKFASALHIQMCTYKPK